MNIDEFMTPKEREQFPTINTDGTFPDGTVYSFYCGTKVDNSVHNDDRVYTLVEVDLSGSKYVDVIGVDFAVRFQNSAVKRYFKSQEDLLEWALLNAMPDNPHRVHFSKLGTTGQFITKEEKAKMFRRDLIAAGVDPTDEKAVLEYLNS